jgi:hypothetical protein
LFSDQKNIFTDIVARNIQERSATKFDTIYFKEKIEGMGRGGR